MIGAISSALSGLVSATKKADHSAAAIAQASVKGNENLTEDIVNLKTAELSFEANAKVLMVAADMSKETGRILDREV